MVYESVDQRRRREKHSAIKGTGDEGNGEDGGKKRFIMCPECRHVSENEERYKAHFTEPRHVNNYRDLAYKEPKKRQVWLKVWFSKLEEAESLNSGFFEVEEEDIQQLMQTPPAAVAVAKSSSVQAAPHPFFTVTPPPSHEQDKSSRHRKHSVASSTSSNHSDYSESL